jgi:uncharacterized tellurite resistance protein B-like protein
MTKRDDWTVIHHLAYVYAAIAFSDGSISDDEMEVFCRNIERWVPQEGSDDLSQTVMTVIGAVAEDAGRQELGHLYRSVGVVADELDDDARGEALGDLLDIAAADGRFDPSENALLVRLRQAWGADSSV